MKRAKTRLPGTGSHRLLTTGESLVSWANVQSLLTRSNMVSWSLYYTAVGHHVNPGMIHHAQECPHTHSCTPLQICHCNIWVTRCSSEAEPLYNNSSRGSIVVAVWVTSWLVLLRVQDCRLRQLWRHGFTHKHTQKTTLPRICCIDLRLQTPLIYTPGYMGTTARTQIAEMILVY